MLEIEIENPGVYRYILKFCSSLCAFTLQIVANFINLT